MMIELHRITVRELVDGYVDDVENGVRGYGGRLDIRPAYQREFVYREKERNAVISTYNPKELERQTTALMADREVQKKSGIYEYLLSGGTRVERLNLRQFGDDEKRAAYETQKGVCPRCGGSFAYEEMEGDHVVPWSKGGKTVPENLQMLCRRCNAVKSDRC